MEDPTLATTVSLEGPFGACPNRSLDLVAEKEKLYFSLVSSDGQSIGNAFGEVAWKLPILLAN